MYRGFNLNKIDIEDTFKELSYYFQGLVYYEDLNKKIQKAVRKEVLSETIIDGTAVQSTWFPQIEADVFISHSHKNEDLAMALAGMLVLEFNLKPFVDSCVWGYADKLLKAIDNQYCTYKDSKTNETMYDYNRRNYTTSHVHLMLTSALNSMIDRSETLIFLQTSESLNFRDGFGRTSSPWLYTEIGITQTIQKTLPERYSRRDREFSKALLETTFNLDYKVNVAHLMEINSETIRKWIESQKKNSST
jgi:hypothetical protein